MGKLEYVCIKVPIGTKFATIGVWNTKEQCISMMTINLLDNADYWGITINDLKGGWQNASEKLEDESIIETWFEFDGHDMHLEILRETKANCYTINADWN